MYVQKLMTLIEEEVIGYVYMEDRRGGNEIRFSKEQDREGPKGWGWRITRVGEYESFQTETVADLLMEKEIDIDWLELELTNKVSDLAYYHKHRLREIVKIINPKILEEPFSKKFLKEAEVVARRSSIRLIKDNV